MSKNRRKNFPELEGWATEVQKPITDYLERFICALVSVREGSLPEVWATGILVALDERPLLITAKHSIDRLADRRLLIEAGDEFVPLTLASVTSVESEELDTIVIALPDDAFGWSLDFLNLNVQYEPAIGEDDIEFFVAMGFQTRESRAVPEEDRLVFKTTNYWTFEAHEAYERLAKDPRTWIITRYDREYAYQDGYVRAMKLPEGMSGGILWRFWGPVDGLPSPARGAFAGVLLEYRDHPVKCMLSSRLGAFRDLARELVRRIPDQ